MILVLLSTVVAQGQIKIGGNVYGGGNKGVVDGNTTVTVYEGEVVNMFGGARMANVGGRTFVNIDGKHASGNITISSVYGGNDVAGTIGQSGEATTVPTELENVRLEKTDEALTNLGLTREEYNRKTNVIDNSWKTFVATSRSSKVVGSETVEDKWIAIGSLFGGGNGEYIYDEAGSTDKTKTYNVYQLPKKEDDAPIATITVDKDKHVPCKDNPEEYERFKQDIN